MSTVYVHLDESGGLRFSQRDSRFYVFAAAWTNNPYPLARDLTDLRFALLKQGADIEAFHAHEDRQRHRNLVVEAMRKHEEWKFAAIVIEKAKVNPVLRERAKFYPRFLSMLAKFVFRRPAIHDSGLVMVFTDRLPFRANREAVAKAIKQTCSRELGRKRFQLCHHSRQSNSWLQVTDYCSSSVFRKWERTDARTYDLLKDRMAAPELDVLQRGMDYYY